MTPTGIIFEKENLDEIIETLREARDVKVPYRSNELRMAREALRKTKDRVIKALNMIAREIR